jgi:hypothetical protein
MTHTLLYGRPLDGLEVPLGEDILQFPLKTIPGHIVVYRLEELDGAHRLIDADWPRVRELPRRVTQQRDGAHQEGKPASLVHELPRGSGSMVAQTRLDRQFQCLASR